MSDYICWAVGCGANKSAGSDYCDVHYDQEEHPELAALRASHAALFEWAKKSSHAEGCPREHMIVGLGVEEAWEACDCGRDAALKLAEGR